MHLLRPQLWWGPAGMMCLNILTVTATLLTEGRPKIKAAMYAWQYACTIPAAMRGDLQPFLVVLSS